MFSPNFCCETTSRENNKALATLKKLNKSSNSGIYLPLIGNRIVCGNCHIWNLFLLCYITFHTIGFNGKGVACLKQYLYWKIQNHVLNP